MNDGYGHAVGDTVLVTVPGLLAQRMRGSDLVARYGGEEFVILLPDTPAAGAKVVGERLRARVQAAAVAIASSMPRISRRAAKARARRSDPDGA